MKKKSFFATFFVMCFVATTMFFLSACNKGNNWIYVTQVPTIEHMQVRLTNEDGNESIQDDVQYFLPNEKVVVVLTPNEGYGIGSLRLFFNDVELTFNLQDDCYKSNLVSLDGVSEIKITKLGSAELLTYEMNFSFVDFSNDKTENDAVLSSFMVKFNNTFAGVLGSTVQSDYFYSLSSLKQIISNSANCKATFGDKLEMTISSATGDAFSRRLTNIIKADDEYLVMSEYVVSDGLKVVINVKNFASANFKFDASNLPYYSDEIDVYAVMDSENGKAYHSSFYGLYDIFEEDSLKFNGTSKSLTLQENLNGKNTFSFKYKSYSKNKSVFDGLKLKVNGEEIQKGSDYSVSDDGTVTISLKPTIDYYKNKDIDVSTIGGAYVYNFEFGNLIDELKSGGSTWSVSIFGATPSSLNAIETIPLEMGNEYVFLNDVESVKFLISNQTHDYNNRKFYVEYVLNDGTDESALLDVSTQSIEGLSLTRKEVSESGNESWLCYELTITKEFAKNLSLIVVIENF